MPGGHLRQGNTYMATEPIKIVNLINTPRIQPAVRKSEESGCDGSSADVTPDEGLRLIKAFRKIRDKEQRERLIVEAERLAESR